MTYPPNQPGYPGQPPHQPGQPYQQPYPAAQPYPQQQYGGYPPQPQYSPPQPQYSPPQQQYSPPPGPQFLPPEAGKQYARFDPAQPVRVLTSPGRRLGARLLDGLVLLPVYGGIVWAVIAATQLSGFGDDELFFLILIGSGALLIGLLYEPIWVAAAGGTPGKLWLGVRVVRTRDARKPGFGGALGRHLMTMVLGIIPLVGLLDLLWLLWDRPLYQCLHDKGASTVVVHKEGQEPPAQH